MKEASPFKDIASVSCLKNALPFLNLSEGQCDKTLLTKDRPPAQIWGGKETLRKIHMHIYIYVYQHVMLCRREQNKKISN